MSGTAVLITAYNRPAKLQRLLDSLETSPVSEIFFHIDGPRSDDKGDLVKVQSVHDTVGAFRSTATKHVRIQESNLGCRLGMHQAIDWFFSHVDSGVILEDDLILGRSAIPFLSHFLREISDNRVWMISGNRQSAFGPFSKASLTKIPHIWGWATWAKKWQSHDKALEFWPNFRNSTKFETIFPSKAISDKFRSEIDAAYSEEVDTWDLGWMASMWSADGFSVRPPMNLITNHGFDHEATHTRQKNHESERPIRELPLGRTSLKSKYCYLSDALEFYELKGSPTPRKFVRKLSNNVSNWEYPQIVRGQHLR